MSSLPLWTKCCKWRGWRRCWGVLPWTYGWRWVESSGQAHKTKAWNLLILGPWPKPVLVGRQWHSRSNFQEPGPREFKIAALTGVGLHTSIYGVMIKCSQHQRAHACWLCGTVGWDPRSPSLYSLCAQVLECLPAMLGKVHMEPTSC